MSGAFVSRAPRVGSMAPTSTPANLGPGAYNVPAGGRAVSRPRTVYAPFSSLCEREFGTSLPSATPAPGTYDLPAVGIQAAPVARASSAAFVSRDRRFARNDVTKAIEPGPGQYDVRLQWINPQRAQSRSRSAQRRRPSSQATTTIKWERVSAPPAIPVASQSFGYKEAGDGRLVRQEPTHAGHTGVRGDVPAPGEYQPRYTLLESSVGVKFSGSRANLALVDNAVPGPGQYDQTLPARSQSSVAFSHAARFRHKAPEKSPAPGAYDLPGAIQLKPAPPPQLQFFGSSAPRTLGPTITSASPGPGAYSTPSAQHPSVIRQVVAAPKPPFASAAPRFEQRSDPRSASKFYGELRDVSKELAKRWVGRPGLTAFGGSTSGERFRPQTSSDAPGPGRYTVKGPRAVARPSSSFASTSHRASLTPNANDTPAPGSYDVNTPWVHAATVGMHRDAFLSTAPRMAPLKIDDKPAPGTYDVSTTSSNVNPTRAAFALPGSKSRRSQSAAVRANKSPGPGQYTVSGEWNKRSFNVTVDA